jgi:hypothetical protein
MGDLDAFFDCMLRAADAHVLWALQLRYSPIFEKVRKDPRMKEAFRRGKTPFSLNSNDAEVERRIQ